MIGDFNITIKNKKPWSFCEFVCLRKLNKKTQCIYSLKIKVDVILINKKYLFKKPNVSEVGTSYHHSLIITALKSHLVKGNAKTKLYHDYSEFNMDTFEAELDDKLDNSIVKEYSNFQNILI